MTTGRGPLLCNRPDPVPSYRIGMTKLSWDRIRFLYPSDRSGRRKKWRVRVPNCSCTACALACTIWVEPVLALGLCNATLWIFLMNKSNPTGQFWMYSPYFSSNIYEIRWLSGSEITAQPHCLVLIEAEDLIWPARHGRRAGVIEWDHITTLVYRWWTSK